MRELFESDQADNPVEAVRRAVRPVLRRRFYKVVTIAAGENGHAVHLDGKPVRTPGRRPFAAPVPELAGALAEEWAAQGEHIDPAKMPRTRLANTIIDGVAAARGQVAAEIRKYLASDLVFYRAEAPAPLRARQAQHWDPIVAWARQALGADFQIATGVVHVVQSTAALNAAAAAIPHDAIQEDDWRLGALHVATTLTGSALLALALMRGVITAEAAWAAAHVDEDWNMAQWGRDEVALQRRAFRFAEFQAAAKVLGMLAG
ncbi:MAG TPA: ATP12 family protein [Xanthobacteraceae bacterium]|nr:ATP12 family protein [Xanthobacteraceae bacterium]